MKVRMSDRSGAGLHERFAFDHAIEFGADVGHATGHQDASGQS